MFSGGSGKFKPRHGKHNSISFLPIPATFSTSLQRRNIPQILLIILLIVYFFNPFTLISHYFRASPISKYPPPHALTSKHTINSHSKFIYPHIEDAPSLKDMPIDKLMKVSQVRDANFPEIEKTVFASLNSMDDPDPKVQREKEKEENAVSDIAKVINNFKNHDKVIFNPKSMSNYPEVVIVTSIDYTKYSVDALVKIVQNRVDYGHLHNYGVYVRWSQEFLPIINSVNNLYERERSKWVRIYALQAARFAFPRAKWFWYLDQSSFIMDMNVNIEEYILTPTALEPIMMRDQPLVPPKGAIKTYKSVKAESIKLILTQSETMVETASFLIKNDEISKSIIESLGDPLYLNYVSFPYGPDSALTHILQWHPFVLSKTSIVPTKTISAAHRFRDDTPEQFVYSEGDFVVQWADCKTADVCEKLLDEYYPKIKKPN